MRFEAEKKVLSYFPRTTHFPFSTNVTPDDEVATPEEFAIVASQHFHVEEKVDGASEA